MEMCFVVVAMSVAGPCFIVNEKSSFVSVCEILMRNDV